MYKNGARATRYDFIDESPNEGSLWASDGQTNYYFTKNKIRGVGDIVSVNIENDLYKDIALEVRRSLTPREKDAQIALAQERLRRKTLGIEDPDAPKDPNRRDTIALSSAAPARAPASKEDEKEVPVATAADIDVSKAIEVKTGDVMMGEIIERFPNGNYKIRATKRVPFKSGAPRIVTLTGVVRSTDIGEDDLVASGKLYEYRLEALR